MLRCSCRVLSVCCTMSLAMAAAAQPASSKGSGSKRPANHLARESSPYLLQHAHNPVDWYPWGPEALEKAKKENKLIFLSIGYSSCHWCHVMERESFSNDDVARIMNEHFVCIKVDREERPDIDQIFMMALQVQKQSGGWPLSMFLLPDGRPVVGGTYWPREDREIDGEKVRGFKTLLGIVWESFRDNPKGMEEHADEVARATVAALAGEARGLVLLDLDRELVQGAVDEFSRQFDKQYGGFGSPERKFKGTKFPMPTVLRLLERESVRTKSADLSRILTITLDRMAGGGICDQLGGGFHRYSTERTWTVPHFEKMLYDNAQLAEVYSRAYRDTKSPLYQRVVQCTLEFVRRELTSPEGAFWSALDADSEDEEGRFYVWTRKEIETVLGDSADAKLFKDIYGLDNPPNFETKYHILTLLESLADQAGYRKITENELDAKLAPLRKALFDQRARRPRPFLDTKVLTAWNGLMIAGFATAGQYLEVPKYVEQASRSAEFILKTLRTKDGRLLHTYGAAPGQKAEAKLNAYLDDYACLVHGLLCLHDATSDRKWLDEASALTDIMIKYHGDEKGGGFFFTSSDHEKLFARAKDQHDGVQPSGNSLATLNLVRLWQKTGDERYRQQAEKSLKTFSSSLKSSPGSLPTMAEALSMFLDVREEKKK